MYIDKCKEYIETYEDRISITILSVITIALMGAEITGFATMLWMKIVFIIYFYISLAVGFWRIKNNRQGKIIVIIPAVIFVNCILTGIGINVQINTIVIIATIIVTIYHIYKTNSTYKKVNMGCILMLIVGFSVWNYYIYIDNPIKDNGLYTYVKEKNSIKGKINIADLHDIKELSTPYERDINTLKGVESMENLESIYIWDARRIKDYSYISRLGNLSTITMWYGDLDEISKLDKMNSVENLGIIYPRTGELQGLESFPNLKVLEIRGGKVDISKLNRSENIEKLDISFVDNIKFEGIEEFSRLTTLNLEEVYIEDPDELLKGESLSIIELDKCELKDKEDFIQKANDKGISVIEKK